MGTGCSYAFGYAHSSALVHDITPYATAGTPGIQIASAPDSFMEQFDGHFGALSATATGITIMMEALAMDTTTQYNKILVYMAELKTLSIAASATTDSGNRDSATGDISSDECAKSNFRINLLMS